MKSSNLKDRILVRLLSYLSPSDRKGLRLYLECPLFNKDQILLEVLTLLEKKVLHSRKTSLSPEAFAHTTGIPLKQLNKIFSALYQHTNDFLEMQERRRHPGEKFRFLFSAYEQLRVEEGILEKEYKKAQKLIRQPPFHSESLQFEFFLAHQFCTQITYQARNRNDSFLDENQKMLDKYYIVSKLKYLCATYNLELVYKRKRKDHFDATFIQICQAAEPELPLLGQAYWLVLQVFLSPERELELLRVLRNLLASKTQSFPEGDLRDLYGYLLNRCMPKVETGEEEYEELLDQTYTELLSRGLLLDGGKLSPFHFKNIVNLRVRRGQLDWVRTFIDGYAERLTKDFDGQIVQHAEGMLHFYAGRKREAIETLKSIIAEGKQDVFLSLDLRNMLWRAYFDLYEELSLEEYEEMQLLYDSFRLYVSRNETITPTFKESFQNFIRLFNKLFSGLEKKCLNNNFLTSLEQEVEATFHITNKKWLLASIRKFRTKN